jgi:hypothetical protein
MERRAISGAVAAIIIIVVVGIGASAYYLGAVLPAGKSSTTSSTMSTVMPSVAPSSTTAQTMLSSSSSQTSMMSSSTHSSMTTSSSTQTATAQSTSNQTVKLKIVAGHVSHTLGGMPVGASCSSTMPAQGSSYLQVTNSGTAPTEVNTIAYSWGAMSESSGAPTGGCVIAIGATEYIKLTGIGMDTASPGDSFSVQLIGSNGGSASLDGTFA